MEQSSFCLMNRLHKKPNETATFRENSLSSISCSMFHPLGDETVKHEGGQWNIQRNAPETTPLKVLAYKVLEQNREWNTHETQATNPVSPSSQKSAVCETPAEGEYEGEQEAFLYDFEERAAIMEYDGGLSREEAERSAGGLEEGKN